MENNKKYEIDMSSGPILSKMLLFSVPLICSSVLQLLFNAADIVVVGKFCGDASLAAVGSNGSLINLLVNLFVGLSIGANVLAARFYGSRDGENLSKTVHTAMITSLVSGLILTVIGVLGAKSLLVLMQTPDEVLDLAALYLRIYFLGMAPNMLYNFGSALLRSIGDTRRPFYFLFAAGIVNVVLNLIFVVVFKLDVAGVAIATVISQTLSAFLVVRCLMKEDGSIKLTREKLKFDKNIFFQIMRIGLPAGFQGTLFALSNVVIQSSVNSFGKVVMAGNSAAGNIEGFVYVAMNAFYQSTISFTSQNMGTHNFKRINRILVTAELCVTVVGVTLGNVAYIFGRQLLAIYSKSEDVINAGMARLAIVSRTYALCGMMDVIVGSLRGIGYSIMPMIVSLMGACVFRIVWIASFFTIDAYHTIQTVYVSYPISWLMTFAVHIICYIWAMKRTKNKYELSLGV